MMMNVIKTLILLFFAFLVGCVAIDSVIEVIKDRENILYKIVVLGFFTFLILIAATVGIYEIIDIWR